MTGYQRFSCDTLEAYLQWYAGLEDDLRMLVGRYKNGGCQPDHDHAVWAVGALEDVIGDCAGAQCEINDLLRRYRCDARVYAVEMAMHLRAGE